VRPSASFGRQAIASAALFLEAGQFSAEAVDGQPADLSAEAVDGEQADLSAEAPKARRPM
jgi:hypothetical protein